MEAQSGRGSPRSRCVDGSVAGLGPAALNTGALPRPPGMLLSLALLAQPPFSLLLKRRPEKMWPLGRGGEKRGSESEPAWGGAALPPRVPR